MSDNENKPAARPQGGPMMGGRVVEKPKDFKKSWTKLIQYSKKHI